MCNVVCTVIDKGQIKDSDPYYHDFMKKNVWGITSFTINHL